MRSSRNCAPRERTWLKRRRTWRVSAGSAGSPIPRAIGSSCGSPPDRVFTQAVTCWWPTRLPGYEPWSGPRGHVPFRLLRAVTGTPWRACHRTRAAVGGAMRVAAPPAAAPGRRWAKIRVGVHRPAAGHPGPLAHRFDPRGPRRDLPGRVLHDRPGCPRLARPARTRTPSLSGSTAWRNRCGLSSGYEAADEGGCVVRGAWRGHCDGGVGGSVAAVVLHRVLGDVDSGGLRDEAGAPGRDRRFRPGTADERIRWMIPDALPV